MLEYWLGRSGVLADGGPIGGDFNGKKSAQVLTQAAMECFVP